MLYAPNSGKNRFRSERFKAFLTIVEKILAEKGRCRILDIGGTIEYWEAFGSDVPDNVEITIANLENPKVEQIGRYRLAQGDACNMAGFPDMSYDIVHSNSVIEHVGQWDKVVAMAKEVRRLAPRYFVQTPNYWFPIEPHYRFPFFQLLPEPTKSSLMLKKRRGFLPKAPDIGVATRQAQYATLLDRHQMEFLFPESEIRKEWAFGFVKSFIAIKA